MPPISGLLVLCVLGLCDLLWPTSPRSWFLVCGAVLDEGGRLSNTLAACSSVPAASNPGKEPRSSRACAYYEVVAAFAEMRLESSRSVATFLSGLLALICIEQLCGLATAVPAPAAVRAVPPVLSSSSRSRGFVFVIWPASGTSGRCEYGYRALARFTGGRTFFCRFTLRSSPLMSGWLMSEDLSRLGCRLSRLLA